MPNPLNQFFYLCSMLFKRFICLLTAVLLLFADSGQMLYARTCLKTGEMSLSFSPPANCGHTSQHGCCKNKQTANHASATNFSKGPCCSINQALVKQAVSGTYSTQFEPVQIGAITLTATYIAVPQLTNLDCTLYSRGIPPLLLKTTCFTQVFRI